MTFLPQKGIIFFILFLLPIIAIKPILYLTAVKSEGVVEDTRTSSETRRVTTTDLHGRVRYTGKKEVHSTYFISFRYNTKEKEELVKTDRYHQLCDIGDTLRIYYPFWSPASASLCEEHLFHNLFSKGTTLLLLLIFILLALLLLDHYTFSGIGEVVIDEYADLEEAFQKERREK